VESADRKKLEKLALEGLNSTADDEERWSYFFRTEGSVDLFYCPAFSIALMKQRRR
jgi:hypothetical protein